MNKELKVIDFYCKKCKKSMKVSYMVTGNRNYPVLPRVMMKCHHCGRVMTLKNFKEGELLDRVEQDRVFISRRLVIKLVSLYLLIQKYWISILKLFILQILSFISR